MSGIVSASIKSFPSDPISLQDGMIVRGEVGKIEPWALGLILVSIGKQQVILPAELEKKVQKHAGHRVELLRMNGYSFRRMEA
jgi:hypothetical protein